MGTNEEINNQFCADVVLFDSVNFSRLSTSTQASTTTQNKGPGLQTSNVHV